MNLKDLTYLLSKPDKVISPIQTKQLEDIVEEFPYFQAARALHLKGLKKLNSFKYNNALKVTAAYTADREVLFDFITSKKFPQNNTAENSTESSLASDATEIDLENPEIDWNLSEAEKKASKELAIGEPLPFTKKEKYSFGEWLQLTTSKPVKRTKKKTEETKMEIDKIHFPLKENAAKSKKFELIDKFIADRPKIKPAKDVAKIAIGDSVNFDKKELMTETLAKVYLEQKKYKKAIQAYRILSLKYPEKSGFFADRIKSVERLKENNL